jgi:hypothetical protein
MADHQSHSTIANLPAWAEAYAARELSEGAKVDQIEGALVAQGCPPAIAAQVVQSALEAWVGDRFSALAREQKTQRQAAVIGALISLAGVAALALVFVTFQATWGQVGCLLFGLAAPPLTALVALAVHCVNRQLGIRDRRSFSD